MYNIKSPPNRFWSRLSVHPVTDLVLQRFNAAFLFSIKFEAMHGETSSSPGMARFFLEVRDLLTTNSWFVTDS